MIGDIVVPSLPLCRAESGAIGLTLLCIAASQAL
jgi:hypothetical protein